MRESRLRVCFIRHGETDWNGEQRLQGQIDLALNARGLAQALALGGSFTGGTPAAIYSSDLLRARQTAQPLADSMCLPVTPLKALRERNFGRCEGLTMSEIAQRYPADAQAIDANDPDYVLPGGESRRQLNDRVLICVDGLRHIHAGSAIIVVTHGGVLDVVYRRARKLPLDAPRDYPIPNTGINWVVVGDQDWSIESWAVTSHLTTLGRGEAGGV